MRFRLAESAIDLINQAKSDITFIRRPFTPTSELKEVGEKWGIPDPQEVIKNHKHVGVVCLARLDKVRDTFAELEALIPKFKIIFGDDSPLRDIIEIQRKISLSGMTLFNMDEQNPSRSDHESIIWDTGHDPFTPSIDNILERINEICGPVLNE